MCTHTLSNMGDYTYESPLLTEAELELLAPHAHSVAYSAGTEIVRVGDDSDFVLYLQSGHVKVLAGEPRSIVRLYKPGVVIGEFAILTGRPRTADLVTLNRVEALHIPGEAWVEFVLDSSRANFAMLRYLAEMVVEKDHRQVESMTTSERKIARGIQRLIETGIGRQTEDGLRIAGFTQSDLGSLSGLSRESAAGVLRHLREQEVLSTGRGSLVIHDLDAINRMVKRDKKPPLTD
jgi:CRP-like cAMP-binding protein